MRTILGTGTLPFLASLVLKSSSVTVQHFVVDTLKTEPGRPQKERREGRREAKKKTACNAECSKLAIEMGMSCSKPRPRGKKKIKEMKQTFVLTLILITASMCPLKKKENKSSQTASERRCESCQIKTAASNDPFLLKKTVA